MVDDRGEPALEAAEAAARDSRFSLLASEYLRDGGLTEVAS